MRLALTLLLASSCVFAQTSVVRGGQDSSRLNYTASGTGATTRTVAAKLADTVSVKDYGATGNGTTDDTTAIQSAISSGAGVVYFPAGTYLSGSLTVPPGVSLAGVGAKSILRKSASVAGQFVTVVGSHHRVHDLTIDGQRSVNTGSTLSAIHFGNTNSTTGSGGKSGGLLLTASASASATSLSVSTATVGSSVTVQPMDYITLYNGTNAETVQVSKTYSPGSTTITITTPLRYAYTTSSTATLAVTDISFDHNTVYGSGFDGVSFWHSIGTRVEGNRVMDCTDTCIDLPDGANQDVTVSDNTVTTSGLYCLAVDNQDSTFGPGSNIAYTGNTCTLVDGGTSWYGMSIGNASNVTVTGNTFNLVRSGLAGINTTSGASHVTISSNTFYLNSTEKGVYLNVNPVISAPSVVTGNTFYGGSIAVDTYEQAHVVIANNTIYSASGFAINVLQNTVQNQQAVVMGNSIVGAVGCAVGVRFAQQASTFTTAYTVIGNNITGCTSPYSFDAGWQSAADDTTGVGSFARVINPTFLSLAGDTTVTLSNGVNGTYVNLYGTNNYEAIRIGSQWFFGEYGSSSWQLWDGGTANRSVLNVAPSGLPDFPVGLTGEGTATFNGNAVFNGKVSVNSGSSGTPTTGRTFTTPLIGGNFYDASSSSTNSAAQGDATYAPIESIRVFETGSANAAALYTEYHAGPGATGAAYGVSANVSADPGSVPNVVAHNWTIQDATHYWISGCSRTSNVATCTIATGGSNPAFSLLDSSGFQHCFYLTSTADSTFAAGGALQCPTSTTSSTVSFSNGGSNTTSGAGGWLSPAHQVFGFELNSNNASHDPGHITESIGGPLPVWGFVSTNTPFTWTNPTGGSNIANQPLTAAYFASVSSNASSSGAYAAYLAQDAIDDMFVAGYPQAAGTVSTAKSGFRARPIASATNTTNYRSQYSCWDSSITNGVSGYNDTSYCMGLIPVSNSANVDSTFQLFQKGWESTPVTFYKQGHVAVDSGSSSLLGYGFNGWTNGIFNNSGTTTNFGPFEVTGATVLDSTLNVAGNETLNGASFSATASSIFSVNSPIAFFGSSTGAVVVNGKTEIKSINYDLNEYSNSFSTSDTQHTLILTGTSTFTVTLTYASLNGRHLNIVNTNSAAVTIAAESPGQIWKAGTTSTSISIPSGATYELEYDAVATTHTWFVISAS